MRAFSRSAAVDASLLSTAPEGSGRLTVFKPGTPAQPASASAISRPNPVRNPPESIKILLIQQLDLLRCSDLNDRPGAPLEPTAHPDAARCKALRIASGRAEASLQPAWNNRAEVARPAPPEVDVDGPPTLPHGQDFALDQDETAQIRLHPRPRIGLQRGEIWIGP